MAAGVHLDERGRLARVDQPKRGSQKRIQQGVVAGQRRLVGGAAQQRHHAASLGCVVDHVDHGQVLLCGDGEALRHFGESARHRQLQGASLLGRQPAQDYLAGTVVAKLHRRMKPGLHHEKSIFEGGR